MFLKKRTKNETQLQVLQVFQTLYTTMFDSSFIKYVERHKPRIIPRVLAAFCSFLKLIRDLAPIFFLLLTIEAKLSLCEHLLDAISILVLPMSTFVSAIAQDVLLSFALPLLMLLLTTISSLSSATSASRLTVVVAGFKF